MQAVLPSRPQRVLVLTAAAAAAAALVAVPAQAKPHPPKHSHPARPFVTHGLVVATTGRTLSVLASDARSGRTVRHAVPVSISVPTGAKGKGKQLDRRLRAARPGDRVTVTGTQSGGTVTARSFVTAPAAFHLYLGTVTAVTGTLLTVDKADRPSDDEGESPRGSFTVDAGSAVVNVDGATADVAGLAVGSTVAVLGSEWQDVVLATAVWGFGSAPTVVAGRVASVAGSVVTFAPDEDENDRADDETDDGDQPTAPVTADLTGASVVVDGVSGAGLDTLVPGSRLVVFERADGSAVLAVGFAHPCSNRHHGDGGQDAAGGDDDPSDD